MVVSENVLELSDSNFEAEVLKADLPVLVDFWAEWCMPCKMLAPTIAELADENVGKIKVGSMDCDSNREVPVKYGISAIPTLLVFTGGEMVKKFVGLQQKADLKAAIAELLS